MPKKLKTLVFVEGECEELPLIERFAKVLHLNLDIYPVSCNIYSFYKKLKKAGMMQNIPLLARQIVDLNQKSERKIKPGMKFHAIYYVYDCDLQHTLNSKFKRPIAIRAKTNFSILKKMLKELDDEYDQTKGRLLINYPMMESSHDVDSYGDPEFLQRMVSLATLSVKDAYKHQVKTRTVSRRDCLKWSRRDFDQLVRLNAEKALALLGRYGAKMDADAFVQAVSQEKVRLQARREAVNKGRLSVLNTSLFLPIEMYGDTRGDYTRIMKARTNVRLAVVVAGAAAQVRNLKKLRASLDAQTNRNFTFIVQSGSSARMPRDGYVLRIQAAGMFFDRSAINRLIGFLEIVPDVDELWLVGKQGANNPSDMQVRSFDRRNKKAWSVIRSQQPPPLHLKVCRVKVNGGGLSRIAKVKYNPYG